jgi:hypothetical protein
MQLKLIAVDTRIKYSVLSIVEIDESRCSCAIPPAVEVFCVATTEISTGSRPMVIIKGIAKKFIHPTTIVIPWSCNCARSCARKPILQWSALSSQLIPTEWQRFQSRIGIVLRTWTSTKCLLQFYCRQEARNVQYH